VPNPYVSPLVVDVADGAQILNTLTETIIAPDYSFAANDPRIYQGASYALEAWFDTSNVVTTPGTLTFRVRWGGVAGTVLAVSEAIALDTTAHTSFAGHLQAMLTWRSIGSAGSAFCTGAVWLNNAATLKLYTMGSAGANVPAVVSALDTTTSKALSLTAQFSVNTATTQLTCHQRIIRANSS
jgi:hypothetical protein